MRRLSGILFLASCGALMGCGQRQQLGPGWEIVREPSLIDSGAPQRTLYRRQGIFRTKIDELVFLPRYYPQDCVVYGTRTPRGPGYYGVCDSRAPVRLESGDFTENAAWVATQDGLTRWLGFELVGNQVRRRRLVFPIGSIQAQSLRSDKLDSGWRNGQVRSLIAMTQSVPVRPTDRDPVSNASMLSEAIAHGEKDVAASMIRNGTDLEYAPHPDLRPIVFAAEVGMPDLVDDLLRHGASPLSRNSRGDDLLLIAVNRGDQKLFNVLMERGVGPRLNMGAALSRARTLGRNEFAARLETLSAQGRS